MMNTNKISFSQYVKRIKILEEAFKQAVEADWYLEDFFDELDNLNIPLECVMTGDIAQVTLPIGMMKRKTIYETAPNSPEAEEWISKNKSTFKKLYGADYEQVMYATCWKMFG